MAKKKIIQIIALSLTFTFFTDLFAGCTMPDISKHDDAVSSASHEYNVRYEEDETMLAQQWRREYSTRSEDCEDYSVTVTIDKKYSPFSHSFYYEVSSYGESYQGMPITTGWDETMTFAKFDSENGKANEYRYYDTDEHGNYKQHLTGIFKWAFHDSYILLARYDVDVTEIDDTAFTYVITNPEKELYKMYLEYEWTGEELIDLWDFQL